MFRIERANNGHGWVIYDGHRVPRTTYATRAEARHSAKEENALAAEYKRRLEQEEGDAKLV